MDARPRRYCRVVLHRLTSEEIRRHTRQKTNTSKTAKSSPQNTNKTYKHSTPTRWRPKMTMPSRVNKNNIAEHSAHTTKYHSSTAVMRSYVNKNETAEDSGRIRKQQDLKMATQSYVNKYKTGEDSARISKQQNSKMATQSYVNKYKTGEDSARINKQQDSGKAIPRCVIDRTTEDNVLIAPKAILKRRKSDSIVETRQNSTKQDNNSCDNQRTSKKQRIKNDYFVETYNNKDENIIVPPRKRKSDSEFETQSTLRSISNQPFEILPKKRRQESSVCDNTEKSITNTKVTTASKFNKIQNSNFYSQLSCNQSTASKNKDTEKETVNGEKANVTIIDNSEISQTERVETYSEMQKNQSPSSKNLEIDNEDIAVVYDNFYTEDRKLNVPSHDINILNGNPECSTTYRSEINNASRKNSHDKVENSRKLLNSIPVYNPNKRYFKMFTAAYENSLKKSPLFQIKNLYRMAHISELDLSSSFGYGNQFSSHLTNKINNNIRLPIDTSEYRFDTVCDLNESFLFNLIAAEDIDKRKLDNLQNIECVIYYSCKVSKILSSVTRTNTNFAGRIILTGDTKHLIKYPADLKDKYSLNTNTRDFPHLKRRSIDEDVADTIRPSNETDVYFTLREMIQGISKKYEKQKHWYHCKCCCSPFSTYNELEPICPTCNIYCTLDFHLKHFDSKDFSKICQRRSFISHKIKHIYTNNATNILKLDKKDLVKELSEKNISASKDSAKILTSVEDELIHETPVNLETFENSPITNPINNTCFHLMNTSPVTGRQESQQELLVENTDEGENVNTSAELIMLDTSKGCGEHETYLLFAVENDAMPEQKSKDLQVVENLESEITDEKDGCEEQDDAILLKITKTIQLENTMLPSLDAEPQGQDNDDSDIQSILLDDSNSGEISSTVEVTVADDEQNLSKNNSVPSCTAQSIGTTSISEPDSSEIQIIEYTSICQSSTDTPNLPLTTSDVSKDLFQNSVVLTCITNPNSPEIQIIEDTPIKSSSDTCNPKLHSSTIDEPEENLSKKSPIPTCISHAENPEIQIIENTPIKSSSDTCNPKLHSTTIDEPEENLSKKSPIPTCISHAENPEIQIIEDTLIKSSSDTDNPKLHSTTIDEPEENLSKQSPIPTCIQMPEIQIIEESSVCLSPNDTSNPKLPSDTIDGTEETLSENSSKSSCISQSDSSEIRIIECTSISQSVDMPNLPSTTADASDDLSENSLLPTDISHCFALKIQIIEYNSVCQFSDAPDPKLLTTDESVLKIPIVIDSIEMPSNMEDNVVNNEEHLSENSVEPICNSQFVCPKIQILEYNSLCQSDPKLISNITEETKENLSENSQMTTRISQCDTPKIQILNYNSICESSRDIQDPKLQSADESVLKTPVIIYSGEMSSNIEDNFVNNEEPLSENSPEPISNSKTVCPQIQILEYNSLCQSDPNIFDTEESVENLSENSQMPTRISHPVSPKVQILECNSICEYSCETSKLPSTTNDESKQNFSENSLVPTYISPSIYPKIQILERNSIFPSSSDIHNPKSPNPAADDSNLNIPVIQSVKSLADTINSTNELLWNSGISDKVIFSRTLPTSSVTVTSINSIEEATLEEEVQRKAAENANSTLERDFCDISDNKDHSESNLIPGRDNYINGCNSESSLRLSTERESTEHDIESNSISHEFFNSQSSKNSLTKKAKKDDDDFTPTLPIVNVSPISSKEEVPLEEKVERENEENSNYTHERNVCELSDTKDHSESNFTSDIASYMNECHSENSLQVSMDAGESTERNIPKSNSFSLELLNSQNSNNLSLKTEKEGGDYTPTLPPANVNELSISCTEEIPLEEVVQRKTAKNSNCAVETDFNGTNDHSESDFISDRDSYLNDFNSENSLQVSVDIEESTKVIPEINSLSREFLNSQKVKKAEDDYTHTVETASVNDSPIISSKDVSVEKEVQTQTAENSNFSLKRDFCDVSDTKDHTESNFISDKDSYMNDSNSENSLQVSRDTGESTEHDVPEVNSMSHELLNSPNSNDLPLKKTKKYNDVSDSSVSSTEELPLEEMQRKNSKNSNYAPERNFCDFGDVKNRNESNSSSNFLYFEEDFPRIFFKYVRVLEDLLPQEITSVKRSNADGSENAYLTLDMLGIASTIASLDILNDYAKVSKFIDFVSKCTYYLENHENRDELKILKTKYFLKKLYVINDFIEKYGTYDKLVEELLKNGGKISAWEYNRGAAKEGNRVRYSNIDPKLSKRKSFLETKGDSSIKGTTSNICDTYLKLLNNPALLADVNQQTSSKYRNPYDKCCALTNCKECNIYSDRNEDKLETIVIASEVYDESNAHMSSEPKNSNSHESGTLFYNRGLRLEKCIKKIKNINEPLSSDVSLDSELRTSPSPSKIITHDSISPISRIVSENLVTADSSQLNNTSCLLDYSRVVEALTTDKNSEVSQNRLSPESLMNEVLKGKRPYRKRSDKAIKEKRTYKKRNVKPTQEQLPILTSPISSLSQSIDTLVTTQEQLPILTSPISSLSQSIDTPVVGFKPKGNAPLIPLCNQNDSLKVSQEQQPASANPPIPLCNLNSSLHMDQGRQYPLGNLSVPLCNQSAICIDQEQPLNLCQTSGNMHYNCKTNPHFDYRMPSHSSPSQIPWHTPITQSSSVQGVPHITGASFTSDALVQKNVRQTDSSSSSHCSVQTSVTTRTDISVETQYASSLRHLANFVSESRTSNNSRGEFSNYEKNIQNTRTFTGSRAVPYPPQCMPRYPETFSLLPPLYSSQTLSSTSQPSSQYMYPGHHPYPCQCYPSMPHCSSTMIQSTPIIPPSFYTQSSYSSSQSTPIIPPSSYRQSSHSSSQSTPIIPPSSYTQSSYSSSQSTPTISPSSYRQSSHSSSQSTPTIPPSSYTQSSYSSSQSTPTISPSSYTQSSYVSSQSTPIIPPSSYTQSSYLSSQSTPISPASSYMHSSYSSFQPSPSLQRIPYPSPRMQQSSSDQRTLPHLHQMNPPYIHSKYK